MKAYDGRTYSNVVSKTFTKDTVAPALTVDPHGYVNASNASAFRISGACSESNPVSVSIGFAPPYSSGAACDGTSWSLVADLSGYPDADSVPSSFSISDSAGNSVTVTGTVSKDTAAPSVTVSAPDYVNASNVSSFPVWGSCTEDGPVDVTVGSLTGTVACDSAATSWSMQFDLSSEPESSPAGAQSVGVSVTHADPAGNSSSASISTSKDTEPPQIVTVEDPV